MKYYTFFLCVFFLTALPTSVDAQMKENIIQSLQTQVPGEGRVTIHQDPEIEALIGSKRNTNSIGESLAVRTNGYRVQVYAGSNTRESRNEAFAIAARVKDLFPGIKVYTNFIPPRWICRVGDFRSIEEADAMMRQLKNTSAFREVSIVREQIIINL